MPHIYGVILDVDGTLIDSNDAHTHSWVEAMAAYGYHVAFRCGGWRDKVLAGAIAIYDGPADLLARFDSSPLVH